MAENKKAHGGPPLRNTDLFIYKVSHVSSWNADFRDFFSYLSFTSFSENSLCVYLLDTQEARTSKIRTSFWICLTMDGLFW